MGQENAARSTVDDAAAERSRDQRRSRRKHAVRSRTINIERLTRRELEVGRALFPEEEHATIARPRTRAECEDGARPCPFVSCAHHLYLDVSPKTGSIKVNFPDMEPDEIPESCVLDVAQREPTLEEIGAIMNLTRERVRQLEATGLAKVRAAFELRAMRDLVADDDASTTRRHLPIVDDTESGLDDFDLERFHGPELDDS